MAINHGNNTVQKKKSINNAIKLSLLCERAEIIPVEKR